MKTTTGRPPRAAAKKKSAQRTLRPRRIFVAIRISIQLASRISAWKNARGRLPVKLVSWTSEKDYHITLVPPWDAVDEKAVSAAAYAVMKASAAIPPFTIDFRRISLSPNQKASKMIWLEGISDARADSAREHLIGAMKSPDRDVWRPHVTIARLKAAGSRGSPADLETPFQWTEHVRDVCLLESSKAGGGGYKTILTAPLARSR